MSDFSLPVLFVVPVGNTLPTTGTSADLTAGQFGIFRPDYSPATAGNVASSAYIVLAQGRAETYLQGSKQSDKIAASKVKKWYKVVGQAYASNEIQQFSDFVGKCDEQLTISFVLHSSYADTISFNGITRSVTVQLPCCGCGDDPCETIANETIIDLFLAKIAQEDALPVDPAALKLSSFLTFQKVGTGDDAVLTVTGKSLTQYAQSCDYAAFPFQYDRLWWRMFAYAGPDTTVDFMVFDQCQPAATITVNQRSNYVSGTAAEVAQMEKEYYSYSSYQKHLFRLPGYSPLFESWVTAGTIYDMYVIQFDEIDPDRSWTQNIPIDERAIIFVPQATSAAVSAILVAYLGAVTNSTGSNPTTTTSTTSTTSSTTTTTTLIP